MLHISIIGLYPLLLTMMASKQSVECTAEDNDVQKDESNEKAMSSQIWTKVEEAILKDSIQGYCDTPFAQKAIFVRDHVAMRIKALDAKKYPPGAIDKGGQFYQQWRDKKKARWLKVTTAAATDHGLTAHFQLHDEPQKGFTWH